LLAAILAAPANCYAAGTYAVWYSNAPQVLNLPYIHGGQIVAQWSDLQAAPGTYDWSALDSAMSAAKGQRFTVQVNGATKPSYLFKLVPYTPNWGNTQANDPLGVPMYWHPVYIDAYTRFLTALGDHLNASPFRSNIVGLRMNFNAVGTEQLDVPAANQKAATWTVPAGAANGLDWTPAIAQDYQRTIIDTHVAAFGVSTNSIRLFTRVTIDPAVLALQPAGQPAGSTFADYFKQGKLSLLFTGGAPELPLYQNVQGIFSMYANYAMTGLTVAYTEPVSDAWGVAGNPANPLPHWASPPQWNYWRILADLALGVSDIALYGDDLTVANSGVHLGRSVGADYRSEFDQAFRFAARHAGFHADPVNAPGAWIAFRQTTTNLPTGDYRQFTDFKRFLTLMNPQDTVGMDARKDGVAVPVVANRTAANEMSIGPYTSRYGSWARSLAAGRTMELQIDSAFVRGLKVFSGAQIDITYLDNQAGASFVTTFGSQAVETALSNSGNWKTASIAVTSALEADAAGGHIAIRSDGGTVIFHMVEVLRPLSVAVDAASFQPSIAPGGLFSIFGNNLGTRTVTIPGSAPPPFDASNIRLQVGGVDVPVLFYSPGQINAQMPYEAVPCGPANARCASSAIEYAGYGSLLTVSGPIYANLVPSAPALFTSATGAAVAQNQDNSLHSPQNPAAAGSVITVYATGLGAVSNQPATGAAASSTQLSPAVARVTATVNGVAAPVLFAGLTPGFIGLAQVNIQIPSSIAPGIYPLVVTAGTIVSNAALISVR
jgi:uncharacterized protein (TIGR03437 family)